MSEEYDSVAETYDEFYGTAVHLLEDSVVVEEMRHGLPLEVPSVLDIGCGTGAFLDLLHQSGKSIEDYVGVDLSVEMLQKFNHDFPCKSDTILSSFDAPDLVDRIKALADSYEMKDKFDLVAGMYSIQYSEDPVGILCGLTEVMEENAYLITTTYTPEFLNCPDYIIKDSPGLSDRTILSWSQIYESIKFGEEFTILSKQMVGDCGDGSHKFDLTISRRR